jgi:hypothetical protein
MGVELGELREIDGDGGLKARHNACAQKKQLVSTYNPCN